MFDSALNPPNYQSLSEDIVTRVLERSRPLSYDHFTSQARQESHRVQAAPRSLSPLEIATRTRLPRRMHEVHSTARTSYGAPASNNKYLPPSPSTSSTSFATSGRTTNPRTAKLSSLAAEDALLLKRERRKLAQIRYRTKIRAKSTTLERKVELLRDVVEMLKQHQQSFIRAVPMQTKRWGVVTEYYRLFGKGLKEISSPLKHSSEAPLSSKYQVHWHFLHATMMPDVVVDAGHGIDTMLWGWEKISQCFQGFDLQLVCLENGAGDSLVSTTKATVTINENIIHSLSPQLVEGRALSHLRSKLLGQRLVVRGSACFVWDFEKDRVVSALYSLDMLTPMLQLLGNLEDVSRVFDNALITPECRMAMRR